MRNIIIAIALVMFAVGTSFSATVSLGLDSGPYNSVPVPRLRYPIYDTVAIDSGLPLEFCW